MLKKKEKNIFSLGILFSVSHFFFFLYFAAQLKTLGKEKKDQFYFCNENNRKKSEKLKNYV